MLLLNEQIAPMLNVKITTAAQETADAGNLIERQSAAGTWLGRQSLRREWTSFKDGSQPETSSLSVPYRYAA